MMTLSDHTFDGLLSLGEDSDVLVNEELKLSPHRRTTYLVVHGHVMTKGDYHNGLYDFPR